MLASMGHNNAPVDESTGQTTVEQLKNELAEVSEELESVKTEFHNYRNAVSKKFSGHEEELDDLEARFEEDNPQGSDGKNGSQSGDLLPIERMIEFRETDEQHPALPKNGRESFERATTIFEHFGEWSDKTPKGRVLKDSLKTLLETVTGEKLAWRQVYRAMDKVHEWTNGRISHETTSRHGHVLVASERPSSVGTGG